MKLHEKMLAVLFVVAMVMAVAAQCSAGIAKGDALEHVARGDSLLDVLRVRDLELVDERAHKVALLDTVNELRVTTAAAVVIAAAAGAAAAHAVDTILVQAESIGGDSVRTVQAFAELRVQIDSMIVAHAEEVRLHVDEKRVLRRALDRTDALLEAEIALRVLSDSATAEFRSGAERALAALEARIRRDQYLKVGIGGVGVLLLVASLVTR